MSQFYVVRPNLGQPLILEPLDLQEFSITVAGNGNFKRQDIINSLKNLKCTFYTDRTISLPLTIRHLSSQPLYYLTKNPALIEAKRYQKFPQSSLEHQYLEGGFEWECEVKVGSDIGPGWQPAGGWPKMFNLSYSGRILHHAIHVRIPRSSPDIVHFLHVTDTHIASRNDIIPEIICKYLESWQQKIFHARYRNYNDNFRAIIKYANKLARHDKLDFLVLTGDIVDYLHDGYFKNENYHYGYHQSGYKPSNTTKPSDSHSNIRKFLEIVTGSDNKGEPLQVPIYVILGNHDYLPYEPLINLDVSVAKSLPSGDKFWADFCGINIPEAPKDIQDGLDRYTTLGISKLEGALFDFWKEGYNINNLAKHYKDNWNIKIEISEPKISLQEASRYVTPNKGFLRQYFLEVSYDTDFSFSLGDHQFVCINTGQDVSIPSANEILDVEAEIKKLDREKRRWAEGHPINRGYISEHKNLVQNALSRASGEGKVFIFTHAPFVHHMNTRSILRKLQVDKTRAKSVIIPIGMQGMAPTSMDLDYDIGKNLYNLINITGKNFDINFAGHTHDDAEYQIGIKYYGSSGANTTIGAEANLGHLSLDMYNTLQWLKEKPVMFISGSQKGRHPNLRDVEFNSNLLFKAKMENYVPRLRQKSTAGPMACFLAGVASHFSIIAGYKQSTKSDDISPKVRYSDAVNSDIDLVMWDMIQNFQLTFYYLQKNDYIMNMITPNIENLIKLYWGQDYLPSWYKTKDSVSSDTPRPIGEPAPVTPLARLILSHITLWLNRLGVEQYPSKDCSGIKKLEDIFMKMPKYMSSSLTSSIKFHGIRLPKLAFTNCKYIDLDIPKRIVDLFEFSKQDLKHPLCMWFCAEATYLADLGGFKNSLHNSINSETHLNWALNQNPTNIIKEIHDRYKLQAEIQANRRGRKYLVQFYSFSSARLAAWAANGDSIAPSAYMGKCKNWLYERIINDLLDHVKRTAEKLNK